MSDDQVRRSGLRQRIALTGVVLSCLPLIGWLSGVPRLVRMAENQAAIVTTTACAFALLFLCLALSETKSMLWLQKTLLPATIGLVIAERIFPGLHALPEALGLLAVSPLTTDAMSGATSIGILLAALVLWRRRDNPNSSFVLAVSIFGASSAVAVLFGNSFDPESLFSMPVFSGMSQYTAILFLVFFGALLLPEYEAEWTPPV